LHGYQQSASDLVARLATLATPETLLILPEAPASAVPLRSAAPEKAEFPQWFRPHSLGPDLAHVRTYLDQLVSHILAACPPGTPLSILGYDHGATAACVWLANNHFSYDRLLLYDAYFPPKISRRRLLADLPRSPVVVLTTTGEALAAPTPDDGIVQDLRQAGLPFRFRRVTNHSLSLAVLSASTTADDLLAEG